MPRLLPTPISFQPVICHSSEGWNPFLHLELYRSILECYPLRQGYFQTDSLPTTSYIATFFSKNRQKLKKKAVFPKKTKIF